MMNQRAGTARRLRSGMSVVSVLIAAAVLFVLLAPRLGVSAPADPTPTFVPADELAEDAPIAEVASEPSALAAVPENGPLGTVPDGVTAAAVYAYDLDSGVVLYDMNADDARPIASVTKIVTALVTVHHVDLDADVDIDESDLLAPDSVFTQMWLQSGDRLTVRDLLAGLLIPSGGDAANALARYVGTEISGETDPDAARAAFVDEMNAHAAELGATNSSFVDPAGEDDGGHSTARDVALLSGELMRNADLAEIVGSPTWHITSLTGVDYDLTNTNELLGSELGITGIKTGSTEAAGASIALAHEVEGGDRTVILIVLGSTLEYDGQGWITVDMRYDDVRAILADLDAMTWWDASAGDAVALI